LFYLSTEFYFIDFVVRQFFYNVKWSDNIKSLGNTGLGQQKSCQIQGLQTAGLKGGGGPNFVWNKFLPDLQEVVCDQPFSLEGLVAEEGVRQDEEGDLDELR